MTVNGFGTGQKVVLVSGGPVMTVMGIHPMTQNYACQWFAGKALKEGMFPPQNLRLAKAEDELAKRGTSRGKPGLFIRGR